MSGLLDFLTARIAEDERAAREAAQDVDARHVLLECAAKEAIVSDLTDHLAFYRDNPTEFGEGQRFGLTMACARLAEVYADHPDFREEWRP